MSICIKGKYISIYSIWIWPVLRRCYMHPDASAPTGTYFVHSMYRMNIHYNTPQIIPYFMRNFRFPARCKWNLSSSGMLNCRDWWFNISGWPISSILNSQVVFLTLEMGPICHPKMSVTNYQSTLRTIPDERRSHLTSNFVNSTWSSMLILHNEFSFTIL
jgi:hypothetical protein